ncbi:hypothetical protein PspLS_03984 [Pyricularia sp. CBS 133598]|nr:hypothetical protein PspLS_03984 [Pyricularia sp. CBS 133598]
MPSSRASQFVPVCLLLGLFTSFCHSSRPEAHTQHGPRAVCPWTRPGQSLFQPCCSVQSDEDGLVLEGMDGLDWEGSATYRSSSGPARSANASNTNAWDALWRGPHACAGEFCVYSNPGFANGNGMVFIGKARNAEILARVLKASSGSVGDNTPADRTLFERKEIPGKGVGLVARRPISRGQLIMAQRPALVTDIKTFDISDDDQTRLFDAGIEQLPSETVMEFLSQASQTDSTKRGAKIRDIANTNSFNLNIAGVPHAGTFLGVSRLNHDCRPNLAFHVAKSFVHTTHATRDIAAGEELTISYIDSYSSRQVRQERLKRNWGFTCTCPHCSLSEAMGKLSDSRLYAIYQLDNSLRNLTWREDGPALPNSVDLMLSLIRQERLDFSLAEAYRLAAETYGSLGSRELALKYAHLALEAGIVEQGAASPLVVDMEDFVKDPSSHWSWLKRVDGSGDEMH